MCGGVGEVDGTAGRGRAAGGVCALVPACALVRISGLAGVYEQKSEPASMWMLPVVRISGLEG